MAPKKRRPSAVAGFLAPLDGLAERWDAVSSPEEARRLFVDLESAGFRPGEELRLAGRQPSDVYRRMFGMPRRLG